MSKYSKMDDGELMELSDAGNYKAQEELEIRGYHQNSNGHWEYTSDFEFGLGVFKFVAGAILILAALLATHFIVAYSIDYQFFVYIGFLATFLFMFLSRGTSKFFNYLFLIGCWALATRLFPIIVGAIEGVDYFAYFGEGTRELWDWIKYALIYIVYSVIVPYPLMKIITFIVSAYREKEETQTPINE